MGEIRGETKFWGRWVWVPVNPFPSNENVVVAPLSQDTVAVSVTVQSLWLQCCLHGYGSVSGSGLISVVTAQCLCARSHLRGSSPVSLAPASSLDRMPRWKYVFIQNIQLAYSYIPIIPYNIEVHLANIGEQCRVDPHQTQPVRIQDDHSRYNNFVEVYIVTKPF